MTDRRRHWGEAYDRSAVTDVSWFQQDPTSSLELIASTQAVATSPIVDVGGGASTLVDKLLDRGHQDVIVLDVADNALAAARSRLGSRASTVTWIVADLLSWQPPRSYRVWHDRAVFHFLTDEADRRRYRAVLRQALQPGGHAVVGTFAADGPTRCSGLPTARYGPDDLAAEFPDLRVVRQVQEKHHTPSGGVQPFTWLVLANDTLAAEPRP